MIFSLVSNVEAKDRTDPEAAGRVDDHPGVDALHRTSGKLVLKRLLEEFICGGLHQFNQICAEGVTVFLKES